MLTDDEIREMDKARYAFFADKTDEERRVCFGPIKDDEWARVDLFDCCVTLGIPPTTNGIYVRYKGEANAARHFAKRIRLDLVGREVRHLCHNPECVNVFHLVSGTKQDNAEDAKLARADGRLPERCKYSRAWLLVEARVRVDPKAAPGDARSANTFAALYGVTVKTVRRMLDAREAFKWAGRNTIRAPEPDAPDSEWDAWEARLLAWLATLTQARRDSIVRGKREAKLAA